MKIGANVEWTSQSKGIIKTKKGTVVAVVPAETKVNTVFEKRLGKKKYDNSPIRNTEAIRNTKSFLVAVDDGAKRKKVYWPRVSNVVSSQV